MDADVDEAEEGQQGPRAGVELPAAGLQNPEQATGEHEGQGQADGGHAGQVAGQAGAGQGPEDEMGGDAGEAK